VEMTAFHDTSAQQVSPQGAPAEAGVSTIFFEDLPEK